MRFSQIPLTPRAVADDTLSNPLNATTNATAIVGRAAARRRGRARRRSRRRAASPRCTRCSATTWPSSTASSRALSREGVAPATDSATHLLEAGGKRVRPLDGAPPRRRASAPPPPRRARARRRRRARAPGDAAPRRRDRRRPGAPRSPDARAASGATRSASSPAICCSRTRSSARGRGARRAVLGGPLRDAAAPRRRRGRAAPRAHAPRRRAKTTYFQIVRDKTASLFAWAARAGARVGGAPAERGRRARRVRRAPRRRVPARRRRRSTTPAIRDATGKALLGDLARGQAHAAAHPRHRRATPTLLADARGACAPATTRGRRASLAARARLGRVRRRARARARARPTRALAALDARARVRAPRDLLARVAREPRRARLRLSRASSTLAAWRSEKRALVADRGRGERRRRPPHRVLGLQAQHGPRLGGALPLARAAQRRGPPPRAPALERRGEHDAVASCRAGASCARSGSRASARTSTRPRCSFGG